MSNRHVKHHHRDNENPPEGGDVPWRKRAHKDWRLWVVVVLMLVAMVIYVTTMDESIRPGEAPRQVVPASP